MREQTLLNVRFNDSSVVVVVRFNASSVVIVRFNASSVAIGGIQKVRLPRGGRVFDQKRTKTNKALTIAYVRFSKNFIANFVHAGYLAHFFFLLISICLLFGWWLAFLSTFNIYLRYLLFLTGGGGGGGVSK